MSLHNTSAPGTEHLLIGMWFQYILILHWKLLYEYIYIYLIFYSIICIFFMGFFHVNAGMVGLFYFVFNEKKIFKYECWT